MSIAISIKVHDGAVLAADSASTLLLGLPQGPPGVVTVYNNANKIFNLRKGLPIGCVTFGAGSIGSSSIATLMKDFRQEITKAAEEAGLQDPKKEKYSIEGIARKLAAFLNEEIKRSMSAQTGQPVPQLGITVSGYSSTDNSLADEWAIEINGPDAFQVTQVRALSECGIRWGGQGEAVQRLVMGFSSAAEKVLIDVASDKNRAAQLLQALQQQAAVPLVQSAMPIQDAIDLARFLVETSISFARFMPGPPVVGGPVEIAAITKHEGFKWVMRKHYWSPEHNQEAGE